MRKTIQPGVGYFLWMPGMPFNSLHRVAALWNSPIQWPRCSRLLFNTYRGYPSLILQGSNKSEALYSKEGVGQGDPLSMLMYASALIPLFQSLSNPSTWIQNWYADDSSCAAKLTDLCDWFDKLCDLGPKYGYHPEPEKCILIVDAEHEAEAKSMFQHLGIKVVNGYRFLGGFIGDQETTKQFLHNKITGWVNNLLKAAASQPQAAFSAVSKSMQFEWSYLQRI